MIARHVPGPCDICGAAPAPFGYAPPPAARIPVKRALRTCAAPACRVEAETRRQALIDAKGVGAARPSMPTPREPRTLFDV